MPAFGEDVVAVVAELGEPEPREEIQAFMAPFREDFNPASRSCSARSSPGSRPPVRNGPGTEAGQTARDRTRP
jgi:hypothetical protein